MLIMKLVAGDVFSRASVILGSSIGDSVTQTEVRNVIAHVTVMHIPLQFFN
jgi:hypothetical protein